MRTWLIIFLALLLLFSFLDSLVVLATDWLWFEEVGYAQVFLIRLKTKLLLAALFGLAAGAFIWLNGFVARWRPGIRSRIFLAGNIIDLTQFDFIRRVVSKLLLVLALLVAYFAAVWAAGHWETWLKFQNSVPFGVADPLYQKDIGFYLFELPLYRALYGFSLFMVLLGAAVAFFIYLINGHVWFGLAGFGLSPSARRHLMLLAALFFLALAYGFRLSSYDLLYSERGVVYGAGYADVHAHLPALKLLMVASLLAALVAAATIFIQSFKPVLIAAGVILAGAIIGNNIYPEIVQRFEVAPNEISREHPFIANGIKYTRLAYGLDKIVEKEFPASESLTPEDLARNNATIENIRLWDHRPLLTTYSQLQEIRTYYEFVDVDNDRYVIDGDYRQIMLSPRELSHESLPSRIWINERLTYTHGYGLCLGPVNRVTREGLPEFFVKDIPPVSSVDLKVTRPEIYYGELANEYVITNTRAKEFDYPAGDQNIYMDYQGSGGINVGSFWRKLLFALRFKELKIPLSSEIVEGSRILIYRRVVERLKMATPFIFYDSDPYMVISRDGRLFWICDGYTVTRDYPYASPTAGVGNYVRNSVKATVDAYNGTMSFYISDEEDPIINTYRRIFDGVFKPLSEMPEDLRAHLRYPERLFSIQAAVYATYHMTDPQVFYNKEDLWRLPRRSVGGSELEMEPYYTIMKLAGLGESEEFILMIPFTPAKKDNMIAWMAARCDPPNYGQIIVYVFPKQRLIYGPQQIESRIDQDPEISQQLSLWNRAGSTVIRGSLLVIPIEESLIYVEPLYLSAAQAGGLPELKRVIVAYGNRIAMEETLERALARVFDMRERREPIEPAHEELAPPERNLAQLIDEANARFEQAVRHQREGNWAAYGEELKRLEQLLKQMRQARRPSAQPPEQ